MRRFIDIKNALQEKPMQPFSHFGARAYANVGLESGVATADPHKLIQMLFDGALLALAQARMGIEKGDASMRSGSIHKAILIIEEGLVVSLDERAGAPLTGQLRSLYQYISARLLNVSLNGDRAALAESERLLTELRDAWRAITPTRAGSTVENAVRQRAAA